MQGENKMQKAKRMFWDKEEDSYLTASYAEESKDKIMENIPNRSWDAIKLRAAKLGLRRSHKFGRSTKLEILLNNSLESFYWMGFLLADAHFSNKKRINLTISQKDEEHIAKFAHYISGKYSISYRTLGSKDYSYVKVVAQNVDVVPKLCKIFDINSNKTKEPPNMLKYTFSDEQLFSLIIGFIDGDGCISKLHNRSDFNLRVKCDNTWLPNLLVMERVLYTVTSNKIKEPPLTKLNTQGYSQFCISNNKVIKDIKKKAIEYNLPIMARKWDKISILE
jgi:hypothetical protein